MSATVKAPISKLPSKPSAMIRLALHDVAVLLKEKKAKINMDRWMMQRIAKTPGGKPRLCEVCFGGAVMMQTLKINPLVHGSVSYEGAMQPSVMKCGPDMLSAEAGDKIRALDYFRTGMVGSGLAQMHVPLRKRNAVLAGTFNRQMSVPAFVHPRDFPAFRRAMQKMARALERHGL